MSRERNFEDKVVLITGGAGGIGAAMGRTFAEKGAHVIIHDFRKDGETVAKEVNGEYLDGDLTDMDATRDICRRAIMVKGKVDILVNNAGTQVVAGIEEYEEETWARLVQIMLIAPFQLIKYLLPGMKERQWGRIINMSSIHGLVASPFKSAYVSAKHGLIGLTKSVALEVGEYGVTVNAICPGYVRTPLVEAQIADQARLHGISEDEVVERIILEPAAAKRLIEPEEVAGLATFLASDDARSITGSSYSIDLGWVAR